MAASDRNTTPLPAPNPFYRAHYEGQLIGDLQLMVERTESRLETHIERTILETRPLMSLGQIRLLLRVFDVCEPCEGSGTVLSRGSDSQIVSEDRCRRCKGKGHLPVPEPVQQ